MMMIKKKILESEKEENREKMITNHGSFLNKKKMKKR